MQVTVLQQGEVSVRRYRCSAGPEDVPYPEMHASFSMAYVRAGSFGYQSRGELRELVTGSFLVGHAGDEFMCTHDHHGESGIARHGRLHASMQTLHRTGAPGGPDHGRGVTRRIAEGRHSMGMDEAAIRLIARFIPIIGDAPVRPSGQQRARDGAHSKWRCGSISTRVRTLHSLTVHGSPVSARGTSCGCSRALCTLLYGRPGPMGHVVATRGEGYAGIGPQDSPALWLYAVPETSGPVHLAFTASARSAIERFHRSGLEHGGRDTARRASDRTTRPTTTPPFLIDPDSNNVEAVCLTT